MSPQEIRELYETAMTWTDGDKGRAEAMVERYLQGVLQREQIQRAL